MKKLAPLAGLTAIALLAAPLSVFAASNPTTATASTTVGFRVGTMLYDSQTHRVGNVYRVTAAGNAELIIDAKVVTVPGSTISKVGGKFVTSLTMAEIRHSH